MADATLYKLLPYEIKNIIQFYLHKKRMKQVMRELKKSIKEILSYHEIIESGGFNYLISSNTDKYCLFRSRYMKILTNLTWLEFWNYFSKLKQQPVRNLSPMISHRLNQTQLLSNEPFKCCHKKWFT